MTGTSTAPRVIVRRAEHADAPLFSAAVRRSRTHLAPWSPTDPDSLHDAIRRHEEPGQTFLVFSADDGGLAGESAVYGIMRGTMQTAYVSYKSFVPYNGKGYLTAGMRLVMAHCYAGRRSGGLGLHRLELMIPVGNAASVAMARRLGFRLEGISPCLAHIQGQWHDCLRYALTEQEWTAQAALWALWRAGCGGQAWRVSTEGRSQSGCRRRSW